jgi:hypothetical protein
MRPRKLVVVRPQDLAILQFLAKVHLATAEQVAAMVFTPGQLTAGRERLARLSGGDWQAGGLLYRFPAPFGASGNALRIYTLARRGRDVIAAECGRAPPWYYRPGRVGALSYGHIRHSLGITAVYVAARRFVKGRSDLRLRCRLSYDLPKLKVVPDLWLSFEGAQRRQGIWIEVDGCSQFQAAWAKRLKARLHWLRSEEGKRFSGGNLPLISYVVLGRTARAGATRRQTLCRWAMAVLQELKLEKWAELLRFTHVVFLGETLQNATRELTAQGVRPLDPDTLKTARKIRREVRTNPLSTCTPEDIRRAEAIVAAHASFAAAVRKRARQKRAADVMDNHSLFDKPWYRPNAPTTPVPLLQA